MKKVVIGVATQEAIRDRALAIARGERKPAAGEPKIWFSSISALAASLSEDNPGTSMRSDIEECAAALNIPDSLNKAEELHRLFDNAQDALFILLAFARKCNFLLANNNALEYSLDTLCRNDDGKRFVEVRHLGLTACIDIDKANQITVIRSALAEKYGVSEDVVSRFETLVSGDDDRPVPARGPGIPCNHHGCKSRMDIHVSNPLELLEAEQRAASELWYCHQHQELAFHQEGVVSDELLLVLDRIRQAPGLSQKDTGASKNKLTFLESIRLINIAKQPSGGVKRPYEITLTDDGLALLDKLSFALEKLKRTEVIHLSQADQQCFAQALVSPSKHTAALNRATARSAELLRLK